MIYLTLEVGSYWLRPATYRQSAFLSAMDFFTSSKVFWISWISEFVRSGLIAEVWFVDKHQTAETVEAVDSKDAGSGKGLKQKDLDAEEPEWN